MHALKVRCLYNLWEWRFVLLSPFCSSSSPSPLHAQRALRYGGRDYTEKRLEVLQTQSMSTKFCGMGDTFAHAVTISSTLSRCSPRWGTANAEVKPPLCLEPRDIKRFFLLKHKVGENIAVYASPVARNDAFVNCAFPGHSVLFSTIFFRP